MQKNNLDPDLNYDHLRELSLASGAFQFGVADFRELREGFLPNPEAVEDLTNAISLSHRLSGKILEGIIDRPTEAYYHHYRSVNFFLDQMALRIASEIQRMGFQAFPIPASQIIDWENQRGHLSHKKVAQFAGLGWLGRNNLLVTRSAGSQVRLVTILTDLPLRLDASVDAICGSCHRCLAVCPAGAIREKQEEFDHLACYEKLKEFRKLGYAGQYICGICVRACKSTPLLPPKSGSVPG